MVHSETCVCGLRPVHCVVEGESTEMACRVDLSLTSRFEGCSLKVESLF
jgi:hypothetical protein